MTAEKRDKLRDYADYASKKKTFMATPKVTPKPMPMFTDKYLNHPDPTAEEKALGLMPEPPAMITMGVVSNEKERATIELPEEESYMKKDIIKILDEARVPDDIMIDVAHEILEKKWVTLKKSDITADGYIMFPLELIGGMAMESVCMAHDILHKQVGHVGDDDRFTSGFLGAKKSYRDILSKILAGSSLSIISPELGKAVFWEDWLDWVWFTYRPEHGLSPKDRIICKISAIRTGWLKDEYKKKKE